MKIGIETGSYAQSYDIETVISKLSEIGFDCLDFSFMAGPNSKPLSIFSESEEERKEYFTRLGRLIKERNMTVSQTHATFPALHFPIGSAEQKEQTERYAKQIEAAATLGSEYIVIHPINVGYGGRKKKTAKEYNRKFYSTLIPYLKKYNVKLAIENMWAYVPGTEKIVDTGCSTPDDMVEYVDMMESDCFVACLDVGHCVLVGRDPVDYVRTLGHRLRVVHLHDNDGKADTHTCPLTGVIDFQTLFTALSENGFRGVYSYETLYFADKFREIDKSLIWDTARLVYATAKSLDRLTF